MRYLLFFALIVVGVLLWRRAMRRDLPPPKTGEERGRAEEAMVQCRVCGVYLPQHESLREGAFHYCCEEHREQDRAR